MNQQLTEQDALKACAEIWNAMAMTGAVCKPRTSFAYDCPCCEYVIQQKPDLGPRMPCAKGKDLSALALCPLKSIWPQGCESNGPFNSWRFAVKSERMIYAKQIADEAQKLLKLKSPI